MYILPQYHAIVFAGCFGRFCNFYTRFSVFSCAKSYGTCIGRHLFPSEDFLSARKHAFDARYSNTLLHCVYTEYTTGFDATFLKLVFHQFALIPNSKLNLNSLAKILLRNNGPLNVHPVKQQTPSNRKYNCPCLSVTFVNLKIKRGGVQYFRIGTSAIVYASVIKILWDAILTI